MGRPEPDPFTALFVSDLPCRYWSARCQSLIWGNILPFTRDFRFSGFVKIVYSKFFNYKMVFSKIFAGLVESASLWVVILTRIRCLLSDLSLRKWDHTGRCWCCCCTTLVKVLFMVDCFLCRRRWSAVLVIYVVYRTFFVCAWVTAISIAYLRRT